MFDLSLIVGFDWDDGNARKNDKHGVNQSEAEEVFFNQPLLLTHDPGHSITESRYRALGRTDRGRCLMVIFALRVEDTLIRVISARPMNRKERKLYGNES